VKTRKRDANANVDPRNSHHELKGTLFDLLATRIEVASVLFGISALLHDPVKPYSDARAPSLDLFWSRNARSHEPEMMGVVVQGEEQHLPDAQLTQERMGQPVAVEGGLRPAGDLGDERLVGAVPGGHDLGSPAS
jgi:hypothetical protein